MLTSFCADVGEVAEKSVDNDGVHVHSVDTDDAGSVAIDVVKSSDDNDGDNNDDDGNNDDDDGNNDNDFVDKEDGEGVNGDDNNDGDDDVNNGDIDVEDDSGVDDNDCGISDGHGDVIPSSQIHTAKTKC